MQDVVLAFVTVTVSGLLGGQLPQLGFIRQKQVTLPDFLANRFGVTCQQSRQVESIGCDMIPACPPHPPS